MENFEFFNPTKVIFGKGSIAEIGAAIRGKKCKKVLLLAGGGSIKENRVYDQTVRSLRTAGIKWVEFWGVRPNPVLSTVESAVKLAKQEKVDAILAVGGGSVVDSGKAVAAGVFMKDVWEAFARQIPIKKALPLFVILTLSATGSEMNCFTVITKEEEKKKWAAGSPVLFPAVSIIDPEIQISLPWNQTVNGGLDALAHIMEFYFLGTEEETTIALDEAIMRTVIQSVNGLQKDPSNYEQRANLAWAATLALNGISGAQLKGGDWATHMIEHGVSALHPEVAHGTGLGILFPAWIQYMEPNNPVQFKRWAKEVWNGDSLDKGIRRMKETLKKWGAPTSLSQLGIKEKELKAIAENIWLRAPLGQLKSLSKQDVATILRLAY
jgi:alcohol dehydrogenase YqhD (iron-dependent ADH family)